MDKIFMIKNSQRNRKREEFSQFDTEHLKTNKQTHNYTTNIICDGKRLHDFLPKLGTTQSSAFTTLIHHRA